MENGFPTPKIPDKNLVNSIGPLLHPISLHFITIHLIFGPKFFISFLLVRI